MGVSHGRASSFVSSPAPVGAKLDGTVLHSAALLLEGFFFFLRHFLSPGPPGQINPFHSLDARSDLRAEANSASTLQHSSGFAL